MEEINSQEIGKLIRTEHFDDWWESAPLQIPFFGNSPLKITFTEFAPEHDKEFIKEADQTIKNFLLKNEENKFELSDLVYKNCMDFLNSVGYDEMDKPMWDIKDKNDIWKFVHPRDIHVTRRHGGDEEIYLTIICKCDWDKEHGLWVIFRRGEKMTSVSN